MKNKLLSFIYSALIVIIGIFITSLLYYFNITSYKINMILIFAISTISIFVGSIFFSKENKYKGIINGIIYFTVWFIIMLVSSLLIFKTKYNLSNLIYYVILFISSIIGGIIGKNIKTDI